MEHELLSQSEEFHGVVYEELHERRIKIQAELAAIALKEDRLAKLTEQKEHQDTTLFPIHVSANHYRFVDGGYIGGFEGQHQGVNLRLECGDMSLAYMLALANLSESLGYSSGEALKAGLTRSESDYATVSYTGVFLQGVIIEDSWERPTEQLRTLWEEASGAGRDRLALLLDEVITNNPYKDIPIRINNSKLYDAMLRKKIFEVCNESDLINEYIGDAGEAD